MTILNYIINYRERYRREFGTCPTEIILPIDFEQILYYQSKEDFNWFRKATWRMADGEIYIFGMKILIENETRTDYKNTINWKERLKNDTE